MWISRSFCDYPSPYSSFEEIPDSKKLHNYEQQFQQKNIWTNYISEQYILEDLSEGTMEDLERTDKRWKDACGSECHHACASPRIINEWSTHLIEEMSRASAKQNYISRINRFYRFLMWHVDYPHTYNPVQFAVKEYQETRAIWNEPWGITG